MRKTLISVNLTALSVLSGVGNTADQAKGPNILLIISDDLNTEIGPYNNMPDHTPHLDRLAKEGVSFTRAYCQYPLSGPSRASFMTGLYPEITKVLGNYNEEGGYKAFNPELADHPSMAGFFREQGYYTARVSKVFHMGIPGGIEQGHPGHDDPDSWDFVYDVLGPESQSDGIIDFFSPKDEGNWNTKIRKRIIAVKDENQFTQTDFLATSQAIAILESRAGSYNPNERTKLKPTEPFFLAVGLIRPHTPFIAPENCFKPYPDEEMKIPEVVVGNNVPEQALRTSNKNRWKMTEEGKKRFISGYLASVRFMDQQVGRLLGALDRLNLREETIVVFMSDQGFNLGEHDCWNKPSLWERNLRVPLIISYPGNKYPRNTKCDAITELIDLYPTLTELCGYKTEQPEILQGKSLVNLMKGKKVVGSDQYMAYTYYNTREEIDGTIKTDRYRYTRWGEKIVEGNEELYDHLNDPQEHINLVCNPEMKNVLKVMRAKFDQKRRLIRK